MGSQLSDSLCLLRSPVFLPSTFVNRNSLLTQREFYAFCDLRLRGIADFCIIKTHYFQRMIEYEIYDGIKMRKLF